MSDPSYDQYSDHVTLNTKSSESDTIENRGSTCARGAIGKYLKHHDLSRHCGTGERQKYDECHTGTQEVKGSTRPFYYYPRRKFVRKLLQS